MKKAWRRPAMLRRQKANGAPGEREGWRSGRDTWKEWARLEWGSDCDGGGDEDDEGG